MKKQARHIVGSGGFTLIELMIAVVIIGILASVAYPSYTGYVVRANRSAAQSYLLNIANREQQYLMDARVYGTKAQLGITTDPDDVSPYYTVTIGIATTVDPQFTLTAAPKAGSMQAGQSTLTLNHAGVKTPASEW